jgi:hypothetical protein
MKYYHINSILNNENNPKLKISLDFSGTDNECKDLPNNITHLYLYNCKNIINLPKNLLHLIIRSEINNPLDDALKGSPNLTFLSLSTYDYPLNNLNLILPNLKNTNTR